MNINEQQGKDNTLTQESSKGIFSNVILKNKGKILCILLLSGVFVFKVYTVDKTTKILDNNGVPDIIETGKNTGLEEKIDPNTVFEIKKIVDLKDGETLNKHISLKQVSLLFRKDIENGTLLPIDTEHVPIGTLIKEFVNGNGDIYYSVQFPRNGLMYTSDHFLDKNETN